jgi:hypothetical protein
MSEASSDSGSGSGEASQEEGSVISTHSALAPLMDDLAADAEAGFLAKGASAQSLLEAEPRCVKVVGQATRDLDTGRDLLHRTTPPLQHALFLWQTILHNV